MDSDTVSNTSAYPPPPAAWAPAPPAPPAALAPAPPAPPAAWAPAPVAATAAATGHGPLTWASWFKASLLGLAIFAGASFAGGYLGFRNASTVGLIGWIAGALVACYARDLRYVKACLAVLGGVFLGVICLDVVVYALM